MGKDKSTQWYIEAPRRRRSVVQNLLRERGVHEGVPTQSANATFSHFLTDDIVQATNEKGEAIYAAEWKAIDSVELMAWIGLHLRSGVDKDAFKPIAELFSSKT